MRKMARFAVFLSVLGTALGAELASLEYEPSANVQAISYEEAYQLYDDMRAPYPKYFQDNPKIVLAYVAMGNGVYVDTTSVVCQIYDPPTYRLAANILIDNRSHSTVEYPGTRYYQYDLTNQCIYRFQNGEPVFNPIRTSNAESNAAKRHLAISKIMWKTAYGTEWEY